MSIPDNTDFHFWLTRSVGRCIGLSFSRAIDDGRLDREGFMSLVLSCRACVHVESCQQWLAGQHGRPDRTSAPEFCPNGRKLDALKPH